jgi:hypothetical protein
LRESKSSAVLRSRWQDVQPRAREQNAFLKTHSWEEYAAEPSGASKRLTPGSWVSIPTPAGTLGLSVHEDVEVGGRDE